MQQQLLALNAVGRCMDYVREKSCPGRNDLLVMLLANLTSLEAGAEALLQVGATGCWEDVSWCLSIHAAGKPDEPGGGGRGAAASKWVQLVAGRT